MARQGRAPTTCQQAEAVIEAGRKSTDAKHVDASGGQLNGKWYPIESTADLHHGRRVGGAQLEAINARGGALDE